MLAGLLAFGGVLVLQGVDQAPPADVSAGQAQAETQASGSLILGPGVAARVLVLHGGSGHTVADVTLRADRATRLEVPAGTYKLVVATTLAPLGTVEVRGAEVASFRFPEAMVVTPPPPRWDPATSSTADAVVPRVDPSPSMSPTPRAPITGAAQATRPPGGWRRVASPLFSALTPGVGQMVNGQVGKGVGILLGTVGLLAGAGLLAATRDPREGASPSAGARANGAAEAAREGAILAFTGAAGLLYVGQILDARRVAAKKEVRGRSKHTLVVELVRMATVGLRAGDPAYAAYRDWSVSVLGQIVPRLHFGISDLSIKSTMVRHRTTLQAGLRVTYRAFEGKRFWIALGLGSLFQGTSARGGPSPLDPDAASPRQEGSFAAIPYGQAEFKLFLLDRFALTLTPRVSVPLGARDFGRGYVLPKYATTFELGSGVGVYF